MIAMVSFVESISIAQATAFQKRSELNSNQELVALGRQVVDQVLAQLDDEARLALAETVGDIRRYVESIVNDARNGSVYVRVIDQLLVGAPIPSP